MTVSSSAMQVDALAPFGALPDFSGLYRSYFGFAWASLRRLGVSSAAIDDAAQDLWVTVHRRLESLDPTASVKAWLFGIARRVASHYRRSEQRNRRKIAAYSVADTRRSSEPMKRREAALTMETFLEKLDERKRVAFVLSEVEGWSAPEIARVAGTNPNTIYSRIRLAKEQLREHLTRADSELSPRECVEAVRASTAAPPDAANRCWLALTPKLAAPGLALAGGTTGGIAAKLKLLAVGVFLGGAGVVGLDAALPETPASPPPAVSAAYAPPAEPGHEPADRSASTDARTAAVAPVLADDPEPVQPVADPRPNTKPATTRASTAAQRKPGAASKAEPPAEDAKSQSLREEIALLKRASQAVDRGNAQEALRLVEEHRAAHPKGSMADLREVLHVRALCESGAETKARAVASAYAEAHPAGATSQRIQALCPAEPT